MQLFLLRLAENTVDSQFIITLFQLLLAGLTLLVLLHRRVSSDRAQASRRLLPLGFLLFLLHFSLRTIYFGAAFFFRTIFPWTQFESLSHGLRSGGVLVVVSAYLLDCESQDRNGGRLGRWVLWASIPVACFALAGMWIPVPRFGSGPYADSALTLTIDVLALCAIIPGLRAACRNVKEGQRATRVALAFLGSAILLHAASNTVLRPRTGSVPWNIDQHLVSISFFAFAWAAGEHSRHLLDRVFVRLNLTFIVLASLIMLITANMEKYQYLLWAEQRSMNLAEFLRGHVLYYTGQHQSLEQIFERPDVLRRVVVEFGALPELREIKVLFGGTRVTFRYGDDWVVRQETGLASQSRSPAPAGAFPSTFEMIRLPIGNATGGDDRVEFLGTMDYLNGYLGKYFIVIYSLFTITVGLASAIIGMIVTDTDRQLQRQYAELRQTQEKLGQTAKLASIGQLAGGMAHEINNPVTGILSMASFLAEGRNAQNLNPRQVKSLSLIVQQAQRVARIVGNLMAFARQSHLELSQVDVAEVIETAVSLVEYRLNDGSIHIEREADGDLPVILGDANRLTEVFVNLLNNAIDAMPGGGRLSIQGHADSGPGRGVRVEVADTGSGIPADVLPRIFDPFFTTKEPGRGTGLGLSVSHGIIKDHGGQIWAESTPGAGTRMIVILPREVA